MSFRFLKKKDGSKVLQQQCPIKNYAWEDVPMVEEETNKDKLMRAIGKALVEIEVSNRICGLTILLSKKFHECLKMEHNGLYSPYISDITSIMGHRVYIVDTLHLDFKILKEI